MDMLDGFDKYPSLRDDPLKTAAMWIRGRRADDGYGQLWRVHDKLYDLTDFIGSHPGGREWLEITRGTDITEAFESGHLSSSVYSVLAKYYVRPAQGRRHSPYTFEPDAFYMTLKKRVRQHLVNKVTPQQKAEACKRVASIQDSITATFFVLLILTSWTQSYLVAMLTGIVLMMNINASHNFFHQKDNWRMYYWDLGLMSSYEWRITHAISHHGYTNTLLDFESSVAEPFVDYGVYNKSFFNRYVSIVMVLTVSQINLFIEAIKRIIVITRGYQKLRPENLLPLTELVLIWLLGCPAIQAIKLWLTVHASSSYLFFIIGITAAHHHPDIYHAGDGPCEYGSDWGIGQLDAVRDRWDVNGILLAELSMYGNHALHHLFPTMDHGLLDIIRPVYEQTCADFKVPTELTESPSRYSQWDLFLGMIKQLQRTKPRKSIRSKSE